MSFRLSFCVDLLFLVYQSVTHPSRNEVEWNLKARHSVNIYKMGYITQLGICFAKLVTFVGKIFYIIHCVFAPLISDIFKGVSTGSELQWGNLAAQEIQLLYLRAGQKIFKSVFCILPFLPRGLIALLTKWGERKFVINFWTNWSHFWQNFRVIDLR